jgi:outer membrane protein assembly factor BamE
MRIPALILIAVLAAACVHKIDIEQGNYVTQDLVDRLKPGMTRAQVKMILGTPLLNDIFHTNRWDYYFDNAKGGKRIGHKHLMLVFKDDKLESWTGDANPPPPAPVRAAAEPEPATKAAPPAK